MTTTEQGRSTTGEMGVAPLAGLTVIDFSTTSPGAQVSQFLADGGAEVICVEPRGGSPLRAQPGWPGLARGKRSIVLDLKDENDRAVATDLIAGADVLVSTWRPRTAERLGLEPAALERLNPRLVSASITGWGPSGPWADLKGYEGLVMAKLGTFHAKEAMAARPGPAFVSVPYAGWGAAQTALHGILTALFERESTGRGQNVQADLVRGVTALDTWTWFTEMVSVRWPDAYQSVNAFDENLEPQAPLIYPLLIAPTKDGHWLQFAQVEPRLLVAMLAEFGLSEILTDPKWAGFPALETQELRTELWETMIGKVGERTLSEWQHVLETNPDIMAEAFRAGPEVLDHPQLAHDGRVAVLEDPSVGKIRQPSTLVHCEELPLCSPRPAPRIDEHGTELRELAERGRGRTFVAEAVAVEELPLAGVTVVEFALQYAGPYGATLLTDLGARVIKVESLEGDTIRRVAPFPEAGGAKVMQGKESICLDLSTEDGLRIAHSLVEKADIVLQSYRAGAAERARIDAATLKELNPDLIYLNASGYGTSGPFGTRPAYAPSIGAAFGFALTDAPDAAAAAAGSLAEVKVAAARLNAATAVPTIQADGIAAMAAASAMLLGLLARERGRPLGTLTTTMIASANHALLDRVIDYPGKPAPPTVDSGGHGFSALYRMYRAADGWVFLAAPQDFEWATLVETLAGDVDLKRSQFATSAARHQNDELLVDTLAQVFARKSAAQWEQALTRADVGCVEVTEIRPERHLQTNAAAATEYCTTATNPIFDEHLRMDPTVQFSRSSTQAEGGCMAGDHTDSILTELGLDDAAIADLRKRNVVG